MNTSTGRRHFGIRGAAALTAVAVLALSGCTPGSSEASSEGGGGLSVIKLLGVRNQTGPVAYTGISAAEGTALAVKEITEQAYLGEGVEIEVEERDSAFDPQLAATEITAGLASGDITAILGPQVSNEALAVAPIAQNAGVPIVFTQSGVSGLLTGSMHFRASVQAASIWPIGVDHIIESGAKSVAIFPGTIPTYNELGVKTIPDLLAEADVEVSESFVLEPSVTDFQTPAGRVAAADPDAVVILLVGTQVPTLVVQLRQAGYDGPIHTANSMTDKQMESAGKAGEGMMFVASFTYAEAEGVPGAFTAAYEEEYGKFPDAYAAEAYDQTWWIARAIKLAGSAEPADVAAALLEVGQEGFTGAQGPLTFTNGNDARGEGVLVRWDGKKQTLAR